MDDYSISYYQFLSPGNSPLLSLLIIGLLSIIFFKRPMVALAFICVQPYFLWAVSTSYGTSFYATYLAVIFIVMKYHNRIFSSKAPVYGSILWLAMILVFWSVISPLVYPIRDGIFCGYSLSRVNFVGSLLPMLLLPRILRTKSDVNDFILSFIGLLSVLTGIVFLCSLSLLAKGRSLGLLPVTSILGVMPHSWEAAILLISLTFMQAMRWIPPRRIIPLVLIVLFCILITDSRTKVLASLFCSAYIILPNIRRFIIPAGVLGSLLFIVFLVLPTHIQTQGAELIENRIDQTTSSDINKATSGRSMLYRQAYASFLSSPWLGVGEGYAIRPSLRYGKIVRQAPHSYYIGVLSQQGLFGASILVIFLGLTFRLMLKLQRVCSTSYRDAIMARFITSILLYGLLCMTFKASWGSTFWSLALLQIYYNLTTGKGGRSPIRRPTSKLSSA